MVDVAVKTSAAVAVEAGAAPEATAREVRLAAAGVAAKMEATAELAEGEPQMLATSEPVEGWWQWRTKQRHSTAEEVELVADLQ